VETKEAFLSLSLLLLLSPLVFSTEQVSSEVEFVISVLPFNSLLDCCGRTTFSLPTPLVSFSSFFSLAETLALALCKLSVAFFAACRCGTINSVVDLITVLGSLAFLPRPRLAVVTGENALTAALVRTTEELGSLRRPISSSLSV
jgi:hypothetical protein